MICGHNLARLVPHHTPYLSLSPHAAARPRDIPAGRPRHTPPAPPRALAVPTPPLARASIATTPRSHHPSLAPVKPSLHARLKP